MQQALCESKAREVVQKEQVLEMQAASVLQNLYVRGIQAELQAAVDYKKRKGKKKLDSMAMENQNSSLWMNSWSWLIRRKRKTGHLRLLLKTGIT